MLFLFLLALANSCQFYSFKQDKCDIPVFLDSITDLYRNISQFYDSDDVTAEQCNLICHDKGQILLECETEDLIYECKGIRNFNRTKAGFTYKDNQNFLQNVTCDKLCQSAALVRCQVADKSLYRERCYRLDDYFKNFKVRPFIRT